VKARKCLIFPGFQEFLSPKKVIFMENQEKGNGGTVENRRNFGRIRPNIAVFFASLHRKMGGFILNNQVLGAEN
jgi:hypothetical protein